MLTSSKEILLKALTFISHLLSAWAEYVSKKRRRGSQSRKGDDKHDC